MLKTYVISLRKPTHLLETLPSYGLLPIWSPGVDGKKLTADEIRENVSLVGRMIDTRPSIGIAMAHVRAWETLAKSSDKYALIVEDDIVLVPDFREKLWPLLNTMPADTDILALGCFGCQSSLNPMVLGMSLIGSVRYDQTHEDINELIIRPRAAAGTHAYIVTNRGAHKLLHHIKNNINGHVDQHIQILANTRKINYYVARERIAFQTSTDTTSTNSTTAYPQLLTNVLEKIKVDTLVNAKWIWTLGVADIGGVIIPFGTVFTVLIGLVCGFLHVPVWILAAIMVVLSLGDFPNPPWILVGIYAVALFVPYRFGVYLTSRTRRLPG